MEQINSSRSTLKMTDSNPVRVFHTLAVLVALVGAGGSLGFTLYTGRHNESVILVLLFAGWVVSPFIALLLINSVSRRWSIFMKLAIYSLMMVITVCSLIIYGGIWSPPGARPAFVFLMIPLLSWTLMGTILMAIRLSPSR